MEKKYSPLNFEKDIFTHWKDLKLGIHQNQSEKPNFSIVLPPPNVTGNLHLGHAWDGTIQDAIIRFKKINGFNTYWVAGKDHAGIATQTTFEKYLVSIGKKRKDYSRTQFIEELKSWVQNNSQKIDSQWEKMGFLLDCEHAKFTLDDDVANCVNDTFKTLYKKGYVYKKLALVNWDVKLQTAISDIEVIKKETNTKLYVFKFMLENSNDYLQVATTRPETMYTDTCLIVNPKDQRYLKYVGLKAISPASGLLLPIIADHYVDIEYGSGIMKCTPAHDFNDYKIGNKYNQKYKSCMNLNGTMNHYAQEFEGLDRLECRKRLVEKLQANGSLIRIEEQTSIIGYSERTNEIVEPLLSKQWFVAMKALAQTVIDQQSGKTGVKVFPKNFNKNLITWLNDIEDWCISRQLWWGHQIPAWYHKQTKQIVVDKPVDVQNYVQDDDVFDTWFSSALWPFVTLGQHTNETEYKLFFPTNVLVTAYDIIFFWVARMMMMSMEVTQQIPFKHLFIHGLIRDHHGRKLSKSLGNFVDLFELTDKFGVDALRLFLLSNSTIGQDLIYAEDKVNAASNFLNKLWNIGNFIDLNQANAKNLDELKDLNKFDEWMLNKASHLALDFKNDFDNYNYVVGIKKLIDFVKNDFSGTYIDLNRYRIGIDDHFISVAKTILKAILIMIHPICCFMSEKIYLDLYGCKASILLEKWPSFKMYDKTKIVDDVLLVLENVRNFKWNNKLTKKDHLHIKLYYEREIDQKLFFEILKVENVELEFIHQKFDKKLISETEIAFALSHYVLVYQKVKNLDLAIENQKIIDKLKFEISRSENILSNENFLAKAPTSLILEEKTKLKDNKEKLKKLQK